MASVSKRPNGRYQARWRLTPGGKQFTKIFDRKIDAETHVSMIVADLERGTYADPPAGRETVAAYYERWSHSQVWRQSTRDRIIGIFDKHVIPAFGAMPMAGVRRSDVQSWVAKLAKTLAPRTVVNYSNVLAMMFNAAILDEVIVKTPMVQLNLPRPDSNNLTLVPITTAQVYALADAVPDVYSAAILAQAGLGLRQSELLGMTIDRIDFLRGTVRIDRQILRTGGSELKWGPPKTAASNRVIPLAGTVRECLAVHLARWPPSGNGLVFTNTEGRPVRPGTYGDRISAAVGVLGFEATSHDLRHYCASMLIASGCSVKAVQRFLGHATAAETLDTYGHLWPDDDDRIRAAIDKAFGETEEPLRNLGSIART